MNDNPSTEQLPELTDAAVARIETAVFDDIAAERPRQAPASAGARNRRRRWLTGAGIAAAFVIGVLVTPPILTAVGGSATSTAEGGDMLVTEESRSGAADQSAPSTATDTAESAPAAGDSAVADREIIATATATVEVKDIADAADMIGALAESRGGYVESTEIGRSVVVDDTSAPAPADSGYGWISIRVPSADLPAVIDELADSGDVVSSSISQQDVTATAIDLRARIDATRASVQRLSELMSQTGTVSELIEAEVALTERQGQLESYEQQLASLEDQVAMSSLTVQLTRTAAATAADPAGFSDGLLAGWNGLVASMNALVVAVGFTLPWLALAGVVVLIVWIVRRSRRSRRAAATSASSNAD
ncbi:DUF4349 domain-containing protein [Microbacterium sp. APC 3901]|uniref:DUF4349 domain-containing protein n=1 Tax=Microbacterium sp. APC 3901 TaxID=3035192 RepID=UPI0025B2C858|nr:DUF4349 domain-containing protein [Microbacterium sp. APC 3901]MDN3444441.1 DUF4349 domain-containing protein [Microbacterium sp. APC 3901]